MRKFRVTIAYEEGFTIEVESPNEEAARKRASTLTEDIASCYDAFEHIAPREAQSYDTVHRDYFVVDVEEVNDG